MLWWNQRMKMHKYRGSVFQPAKFKPPHFSQSLFKGSSPKQAICPFCFKVFYDKSTMNRHVSKRVCLGLQFQTSDACEDVPVVPNVTIMPVSRDIDVSGDVDVQEDFHDSVENPKSEEVQSKSSKVPCPYCKKPMKGERGVRKHLDFYGCPMARSARDNDMD